MRPPTLRAVLPSLIGLSLAASIGCVAVAVYLGLAARTATTSRAARLMTERADTIAREIETGLAQFDLALREAVTPREASQPPPRAPMLELPLTARYVGFMNVLNEVGDVVADSRSNVSRPANFGGRDYFQDHLKDPTDTLMIGRPFGMAPNQHASIPISRRLTAPDGRFAGVVVAGIHLTWLSDLLSHEPAGTVTIRRDDGLILMRNPFDADAIGHGGSGDPAWQTWLSTGPVPFSDKDGGLTLFHRAGTTSLVVELTLSQAEIAGGERSWLIWLPPLALIPGLCVLGLGILTLQLRHRGDRIEAGADAANDDRMRVMANMSHELRTPLTGILGQVELMTVEGGFSDRQASRLAKLTEAAMLMRTVANRVIDVARPSDPDAPPVRVRCDLDPLIRACTGLVETEAARKGLLLTTIIDPATPEQATLARDLVQQVLINLLMNAVKFTAKGTVALRVSGDAAGLRFEVADTGPGIPAGKKRRLFRAYDRLDATSAVEGTGLGLSITKRFVHRMGGRIGHAHNPGGGSVFWVDLPTPAGPMLEVVPHEAPLEITPEPETLRILLADDLAMTRSVTADFLRSAGHSVTEVADGEAAVEAVRTGDYDVILTDMRMPVMDGLEATRRIRALPGATGRTPLVLVTADLVALGMGRSGRTGVDVCLMKPFTRAELLEAVATASRLPGVEIADPPVLTRELADKLAEEAFSAHRGAAAGRIEDLMALLERPDATESQVVKDAVHDLVGISGMLGLTALAGCLVRFDVAEDRSGPAAALRDAGADAVRALRQ
jgi:signal transduction histidine kinase/CheY-like chemotaxis protein